MRRRPLGPPPPLETFLERGSVRRPLVRGAKARACLAAMTASPLPGGDNATAVLDLYGMAGHRPAWVNKVPCLTRTRCGENGYWISNAALGQRGMLTTKELLRLQGLPESLIGTAKAADVTDRQLRLAIGNAMSMNVLACALRRILKAIGHA